MTIDSTKCGLLQNNKLMRYFTKTIVTIDSTKCGLLQNNKLVRYFTLEKFQNISAEHNVPYE